LGKAKCESTQHPKFDRGKNSWGEIPLVAKSRGPHSNALVYAKHALLT